MTDSSSSLRLRSVITGYPPRRIALGTPVEHSPLAGGIRSQIRMKTDQFILQPSRSVAVVSNELSIGSGDWFDFICSSAPVLRLAVADRSAPPSAQSPA